MVPEARQRCGAVRRGWAWLRHLAGRPLTRVALGAVVACAVILTLALLGAQLSAEALGH